MDHSKRCLYEIIVMVYERDHEYLSTDQFNKYNELLINLTPHDRKIWDALPEKSVEDHEVYRKIYQDAVDELSHDARIAAAAQLATAIEVE